MNTPHNTANILFFQAADRIASESKVQNVDIIFCEMNVHFYKQ